MSMHQGASNIEELSVVVARLAKDMLKKCDNSVKEIVITLDEEDDTFDIISD